MTSLRPTFQHCENFLLGLHNRVSISEGVIMKRYIPRHHYAHGPHRHLHMNFQFLRLPRKRASFFRALVPFSVDRACRCGEVPRTSMHPSIQFRVRRQSVDSLLSCFAMLLSVRSYVSPKNASQNGSTGSPTLKCSL